MKARLFIDDAVGELRRLLVDEQGRPFRLDIERWSERGQRIRLNETRWGRVKARIPGDRGWFVDLGVGPDGLVAPTRAAHVTEGAMLAFRVKAEPWADKGPLLSLADMPSNAPRPDKPEKHAAAPDDPFVHAVDIIETLAGPEARIAVDAALDEATSRTLELPGGGDIAIEAARGAVLVDVDGARRKGAGDAERFALDLNLAAAEAAARQIALRNLGGLILIDFVGLKQPDNRRRIARHLRHQLALRLGRSSDVLDLSRLNVCEAAIARRSRPLADALAAPADEREALDALRLIETAGWQTRGARIMATLSEAAVAWLERDPIGGREALTNRIGPRWTLAARPGPAARPDVRRL